LSTCAKKPDFFLHNIRANERISRLEKGINNSCNQGIFPEKAIFLVLEQGYPRMEYIIIAGGSIKQ